MHRPVWGRNRWWGKVYRRVMMGGAVARLFWLVHLLQERQMDIIVESWVDQGFTDLAEMWDRERYAEATPTDGQSR